MAPLQPEHADPDDVAYVHRNTVSFVHQVGDVLDRLNGLAEELGLLRAADTDLMPLAMDLYTGNDAQHLLAQAARTLRLLRAVVVNHAADVGDLRVPLPAAQDDATWWCPRCRVVVPTRDVNEDNRHTLCLATARHSDAADPSTTHSDPR